MERLDPIVAEISPNLYKAGIDAGLVGVEKTQVEQFSYALKEHRRLSKLNEDEAKKQYSKLDVNAKKTLGSLFKSAPYLQPDPSFLDQTFGVIKRVIRGVASPLVESYEFAGGYGRMVNEGYLLARQAQQGDGLSVKTWNKAWDGKSLYDENAIARVKEHFGASDTLVAQELLAGKTAGDILIKHGVSEDLLASISKAYGTGEDFKQVMDATKYAQISPGRDLARMLDDIPTSNGGVHGDYVSSKTKNISGITDFIYQIAVDPLTWISGGTTKGATVGERLVTQVTDAAKRGELELGVRDLFKKPEIFNLWENQLGPALKKLSEATTYAGKKVAYEELVSNNPGYRNRDIVNGFVKNKLFDADSAMKYFAEAKNIQPLLSGSVAGVDYARFGVVTARKHRNMADGFMNYMDSVFNATEAKQLGRLKTEGRTVEQSNAKGETIWKAFGKSGEALDVVSNPAVTKMLKELSDETKGLKKIGLLASRSPIGREIRWGAAAAQSYDNLVIKFRTLMPRDLAEYMATRFISSSENDQVVIMRTTDAAIMLKAGLGGNPEGRLFINKVLADKYGGKSGTGVVANLEVNPEHARYLEQYTLKNEHGVPMIDSTDTIHPFQESKALGALPYAEIAAKANEINSKRNIFYAIGGAVAGDTARKVVDVWSLLTLFPRLGIRSAIDEGLMYLLTAPGKDLFHFAARTGNRMGKVITVATGSNLAVGPIKSGLLKVIGKAPQDAMGEFKRMEALRKYADLHSIDIKLLTNLQKREAVGETAMKIYGGFIPPQYKEDILDAFIHQPEMLNSAANSIVAASGLSGKYAEEVLNSMVEMSNLSKHLEALSLKRGSHSYSLSTAELATANKAYLTLAHHENWFLSFVANRKTLANGRVFDPAHAFFNNMGLKTGLVNETTGKPAFLNALDELSQEAGLSYNVVTKSWYVQDKEAVDSFLQMSSRTSALRQRNVDDVGIVRDQIGRILADMQTTFHGSATGYNKRLFDAVVNEYNKLMELGVEANRTVSHAWGRAASLIDYKRFDELTVNHKPVGEIQTAIDFPGFSDNIEGAFRAFGNKLMSGMDRQINAIFRQPAVMVTYVQLREQYRGIEKQYVEDMIKAMTKENPSWYVTKGSQAKLRETVVQIAKKRYTEIASRDAVDKVMMFADNPAIRSNAAFSMRTVGRYYRATEDFQRRIWRLSKVAPRVLYRLRLAHQGLDANGAVHEDVNGDPYIIMPMDNIIYKATDSTIRTLTGSGYSQPQFSEFTMKLKLVNPSFQQDSGLPTLAGPFAGLAVIGIKNLLGSTNNPFITKVGEGIDSIALGSIGDNINVVRATIPSTLLKLWSTLPVNEKTRQEVTAGQMAMAYMAGHGKFLNPKSTAEEKTAYIKNLRIAAHNVVALRGILGLISPAAPSIQESLDIPDYLKDIGVTGLRPEFFDILNGISLANDGTIQDPYSLALSTFIGKHPGKLIYTVPRTTKETKVIVKNTEGLKNWTISNEKLIKTYGETAFIFAPQVGEFSPAAYNWIQAAGFLTSDTLEKYYDNILVIHDKQAYYGIAEAEKKALEDVTDPYARSVIINNATAARKSLKDSNPMLEPALIGGGNSIGSEKVMMIKLQEIVNDMTTSIDPGTRQRMSMAIKQVRAFIDFANDPQIKLMSNYVDLKRERKAQVEAQLKDLMTSDLYVTEANRALFQPILNNISRESYSIFPRSN